MGWLSKWLHKHNVPETRQLPGSTERIERALILPTCDKPNSFLKRLDATKEIKCMQHDTEKSLRFY